MSQEIRQGTMEINSFYLFHHIWALTWEDWNSWEWLKCLGLESSGRFRTQRLGWAGTVETAVPAHDHVVGVSHSMVLASPSECAKRGRQKLYFSFLPSFSCHVALLLWYPIGYDQFTQTSPDSRGRVLFSISSREMGVRCGGNGTSDIAEEHVRWQLLWHLWKIQSVIILKLVFFPSKCTILSHLGIRMNLT